MIKFCKVKYAVNLRLSSILLSENQNFIPTEKKFNELPLLCMWTLHQQ